MNKLGATGLGLLAILVQQPLDGQTQAKQANSNAQSRQQAQQRNMDVEFLDLYKNVSDLERTLSFEAPDKEKHTYINTYKSIDGTPRELELTRGPYSISDIVLQAKHEKIAKLASRYGIDFNIHSTQLFTWGDSLVINRSYADYVIFDQFSAIIAKTGWVGEIHVGNYHYSYEVLRSAPEGLGFKVLSYGEVSDGAIPLFESFDFAGIASKIRQLKRDERSIWTGPNGIVVNQVPEFKGLNFDDTKSHFATRQLTNIGAMLLAMIENMPELENLSVAKQNIILPSVRYADNRILLSGKIAASARWDLVQNAKPEEEQAIRSNIAYVRKLNGDFSLSIAPNGNVNYWFRLSDPYQDQTPVYENLTINFQKFFISQ